MKSLLILGRQPALGLAELESLFSATRVEFIAPGAALVDITPADIPFTRLGGSIKLTKLLAELPYTEFNPLVTSIEKILPPHLQYLPDGKIKFGISTYGIKNITPNDVNRATLRIKKVIRGMGRSVRVIPNTDLTLNSAQVRHNQLTSPVGIELVLVRDGNRTLLAQTVTEQDIDAYAARDQGRPKRDSKVGMLPPKLAQIIINLAQPSSNGAVLDPFCGTGVVLQEAALMGFRIYGSDLEKRMIDYTNENLEWLKQKAAITISGTTEVGDATKLDWQETSYSTIAGETYLGRPFSTRPEPSVLQGIMQDVNLIHKRFLQNVARQTKTGFRMCIAVPAWHINHEVKHLKILDNLGELGYNRIEFVHAGNENLVYHREGQIVGRELVVLVRK